MSGPALTEDDKKLIEILDFFKTAGLSDEERGELLEVAVGNSLLWKLASVRVAASALRARLRRVKQGAQQAQQEAIVAGWPRTTRSPSAIAQASETKAVQSTAARPMFLMYRPPDAKTDTPFDLIHPIFGVYNDIINGRFGGPAPQDEAFAVKLSTISAQHYGSEKERLAATKPLLQEFLSATIKEEELASVPKQRGQQATTDGTLSVEATDAQGILQLWLYLWFEWRHELGEGGGDPLMKSLAYMQKNVFFRNRHALMTPSLAVDLYGCHLRRAYCN